MSSAILRMKEGFGPDDPFHKDMKTILRYLRCDVCGRRLKFDLAYVRHSICYGGPADTWCTKRCLDKRYDHR